MIVLQYDALVLLLLIIVQQVTLPCRYGICAYCVMGTWGMR